MNRYIPVVALGLLFASCEACVPRTSVELPTTSDPGVTLLRITDADGSKGQCTAFKVREGLVATAGHCISEGILATYSTEGLNSIPGADLRVLYVDREGDVAILGGPMGGDAIGLAERDPGIGEAIWTRGYPHGTLVVSDGYWSGRDADGKGIVSVVIAGGASGSPVFDAHGRAVGVTVSVYRGGDNIGFVANLETLRHAISIATITEASQ